MTKREEIIKILDKHIPEFSDKVKIYIDSRLIKGIIADEILALPIDVPTDADIEAWVAEKLFSENKLEGLSALYIMSASLRIGLIDGAKAMRDGEILKRNNK